MSDPNRRANTQLLVDERFPLLAKIRASARDLRKAPPDRELVARLQAEERALFFSLAAKPDDEIADLAKGLRDRKEREAQAKTAAEEAKQSFARPSANADFDHWAKVSLWTIEEAVALSLGKSPAAVNKKLMEKYSQLDYVLPKLFMNRLEIARRAVLAQQLYDPVYSQLFLAWALRMKIDVPEGLVSAVEALGIQVADWKTLFDDSHAKLSSERLEAEATIRALEERIEELTSATKPNVSIRERETLLKLVISMAVKGYAYDPSGRKNSAITEIADDTALLGIPVSDDTVRKYLNAAKDLLARDE